MVEREDEKLAKDLKKKKEVGEESVGNGAVENGKGEGDEEEEMETEEKGDADEGAKVTEAKGQHSAKSSQSHCPIFVDGFRRCLRTF